MRPFTYHRAVDLDDAIEVFARDGAKSSYIGGGTSLVDLMKIDAVDVANLVDLNRIGVVEIKRVNGGISIGALAKNSDVAHHPIIEKEYPILSQALLNGASVQLRNMATVGGNLMQRSRCPYFRDTSMKCNKREPGTGCPAIEGFSRLHAILGVSDYCISAHPSDMCVALVALDATMRLRGPNGMREVAVKDFYLLPEDHPDRETVIEPGELIISVEIPPSKFSANSHYIKIRDRSSFTFAIVAVAACLELEGTRIQDCRVVLGGVGTKPWRAETVEKLLIGQSASRELFTAAAAESVRGARASKHNKFKLELTPRTVARALENAAGIS